MSTDIFSLEGRTALVTGGSRGLGREMALAFAKNGANVAVVSRKIQNCESVAEEIRNLGRESIGLSCHVGHWDELEMMVSRVVEKLGPIDLLVNNFVFKAFTERSLVLYEDHFRRNFIHIKDVAKAFIFSLDKKNMLGEVYNLGLSSANLTKKELAEKIKQLVEK